MLVKRDRPPPAEGRRRPELERTGPPSYKTTMNFLTALARGFDQLSGPIRAILFLGEVVRLRRWTAIIVGFMGALVIIRPGFQDIDRGVLFVLGAVAGQSWNSINIKILTRTEVPDTIVVYYALFILPLALVPALFV